MIEIYFDGACEPINPGGTTSYGWIIKKDGKVIAKDAQIFGSGDGMTNNVAEYTGLIEAVKTVSNLNMKEKLRICGDSKIVCYTIAKKWGWNKKKTAWDPHKNASHLKSLLEKATDLLKNFEYEIKWVPREKNRQADDLSKEPLIKVGIIKAEIDKEKCPRCDGFLVERTGKFGVFYGCSNYPRCNFTKKIDKSIAEIKPVFRLKNKQKYQVGNKCPKGCGGKLLWASGKMTKKRSKKAYHFEKWLKCDKCKAVFFDEKYKVIHELDPTKKSIKE